MNDGFSKSVLENFLKDLGTDAYATFPIRSEFFFKNLNQQQYTKKLEGNLVTMIKVLED